MAAKFDHFRPKNDLKKEAIFKNPRAHDVLRARLKNFSVQDSKNEFWRVCKGDKDFFLEKILKLHTAPTFAKKRRRKPIFPQRAEKCPSKMRKKRPHLRPTLG